MITFRTFSLLTGGESGGDGGGGDGGGGGGEHSVLHFENCM